LAANQQRDSDKKDELSENRNKRQRKIVFDVRKGNPTSDTGIEALQTEEMKQTGRETAEITPFRH
jgi:hypothetical protein